MKIKDSIIWLTIIAAVFIVLVLWYGKKEPVETPLAVSTATNVAPSAAPAPNLPASASLHANAPMVQTTKGAYFSKSPAMSKEERAIGLLSTYNDVPIDFYGRVEDQFGNAVDAAAVNFSVRIMNGQESTVKRGQVLTDGNGFFAITGYKGQDLGLVPQKAGYTLATTGTLFKYSHLEDHPYVPDPNNPTVIKMWKLQGAEPLIHFSFKARIPYDGTPVVFDLHTGKIVDAGGDLIIRLKSPLEPSSNQQYDWQATIQPVDGGIISSDVRLESRLGAPDSGYDSQCDINYRKDVKPWSSTFHGGFYFKDHGGSDYGKFDVGIVIYAIKDGFVPITLDGYINPAGSRNLEIDPKLVTEAHP